MATDSAAFHDFERAGWERAAEYYGDAFGGLTAQTAAAILDSAGVGAGVRLLDVACGPGFVAAAGAGRGASVTGLDFAARMVAEAKRRHPEIDFREGDAQALPFDAGSFDAVIMNFGMLHLARPEQAIAEARRVLRPGGRYAFTVWADPSLAVGFGITLQAIQECGNANVPLPEGPPFFRFSSPDETRRTLTAGGFIGIEIVSLPLTWTLTSPEAAFEAMQRGGVRTAAVLRAQTPEALAKIGAAVVRKVAAYAKDGRIEVPMPAVLTSATRP